MRGRRIHSEHHLAGWADVGRLTTGRSQSEIADWLAERRSYLAEGRSRLRIGHVDIFARPIGTRKAIASTSGKQNPSWLLVVSSIWEVR